MPGLTGRTDRKRVGRTPAPRPSRKEEQLSMPEAAIAAPEMYKVIFENSAVQVMYIHIAQGETAPMHSHPFPYLTYALSSCRVRFTSADRKTEEVEMAVGDVQWREAEAHQSVNVGASDCQVLFVGIKSLKAMRFEKHPSAPDAISVGRDLYRVLFENQMVSVADVRMLKGEVAGMHSHQGPYLTYPLSPAKVRFSYPDGTNQEVELRTGAIQWHEAEAHQVENVGDSDCHALVIEMKKG